MNILIHICCSNCSLYPVKILRSEGHDFSGFWFNPNIHPIDEYHLRLDSLRKLAEKWHINMNFIHEYEPEKYFELFDITDADLLNNVHSGNSDSWSGWNEVIELEGLSFPERCSSCYRLRLEKTAAQARESGFDAFTTTLLISPYQDIEKIKEIGEKLAEENNILFYFKDFRPSYRDAITLSRELGLYRQKYCGCIFSREERKQKGSRAKEK